MSFFAIITHVNTVTANNVAGSAIGNLSPNVPTNTKDGDFMIASVFKSISTSTTLTAPSGWTRIRSIQDATANLSSEMFYRIALSEPASYTWQMAPNDAWGVAQTTLRGVNQANPIQSSNSGSTTTADPYSCPTVSTTTETYIINFGASRDDNTTTEVTHTASGTELADWGMDGGVHTRNGAVYLSAKTAAGGSVGGLSINPSGTITDACQWTVALEPQHFLDQYVDSAYRAAMMRQSIRRASFW